MDVPTAKENTAFGFDLAEFRRVCRGESRRAHEVLGAHRIEDGRWRFAVYAPKASAVWLKGDFSGWDGVPMARLRGGVWVAAAEGVHNGDIYKYAVVDRKGRAVDKSDPFAPHWETPPADGGKIWDTDGYDWGDGDWMARRGARDVLNAPMSVYELHLGSWRAPLWEGARYPSYRDLAAALAEYCTDMGYTHVELLPVTEHPYEPSWGYQVTGYFAPTSRFGTPQDFQYFVDALHRAGVGVLMDWVPAHFPRDEYALARFDGTPLYERGNRKMAAHPHWGTLIFDYDKPFVRSFLKSSAAMFFERYHIDGLRVDAVSSMLYRSFGRGDDYRPHPEGGEIDLGAVALLREINALARERGALTVAEESGNYPGVTAPMEAGGLGFTFKWDMGYMHDMLDYMSLDPLWRRGSHNKLSFSMHYAYRERYVLAFSHDEVVHGKKSMLDKMPGEYDDKFSNLRALYGFTFAHPGKKLNFMGGDFGQFIEWDFHKPLDWFLLDYPRHAEMRRWMRELNRFYVSHPALWARDADPSGFAWLNADDADRNSVAFLRDSGDGEQLVCVCNFTPEHWEFQIALPRPGVLRRALSSDEYRFGGAGGCGSETARSAPVPFREYRHSAMLRLPPLSCTYYFFE